MIDQITGKRKIVLFIALSALVSGFLFGCAGRVGMDLNSADLVSGWYDKEGGFRWMAKTAEADFSPGNKGLLHIEGIIRPKIYEGIYKGKIELKAFIDGKPAATFALPEGDFIVEKDISDLVKGKNTFTLRLVLNKSFNPSSLGLSKDIRELGIMVKNIVIE